MNFPGPGERRGIHALLRYRAMMIALDFHRRWGTGPYRCSR